jgi:acyl-coenzyme A thioesterase PaaI-like protein
MPADPEELVALMPFARQLGVIVDEASADRVVARLDWAPHLCTAAHRGRTTVTAQTSLFDDRDRLVAQTTQIQAVRGGD